MALNLMLVVVKATPREKLLRGAHLRRDAPILSQETVRCILPEARG
jgi:hypothetical protein